MNSPKKEPRTKAITIRIPTELHERLKSDAAAQDWTVNDEINHRLRAMPVQEQLRQLLGEIADLKELVKSSQQS